MAPFVLRPVYAGPGTSVERGSRRMVMMKRQWLRTIYAVAGLVVLTAGSAGAQVVQVTRGDARNAIQITFGEFFLTGIESRGEDDVLRKDLEDVAPLAFEIKDFNGFTFGGEYLFGINRFLEAGFGASYYQQTVHSVYRTLVNTNGSEIRQDLKLKILPISATIRFLPLGRGAPVEPYIGGGIAALVWQYSESGDFVDTTDYSVFTNSYKANGTEIGPIALFGLRVPIGDTFAFGAEGRWQHGEGDTGGINEGFLGDKINLGGWTANATVHFRF